MTRLIDCQTPRTPDTTTLERLREIDPMADLLYVGNGRWILGVMGPTNEERYSRGREILSRELARDDAVQRPRVIRLALAARQGFRVIGEYSEAQLWSGEMVRDFRAVDFLYRQGRERLFERGLADSELHGRPMEDRLEDVLYRARDVFRTASRRSYSW